jgi:hypothetical protein
VVIEVVGRPKIAENERSAFPFIFSNMDKPKHEPRDATQIRSLLVRISAAAVYHDGDYRSRNRGFDVIIAFCTHADVDAARKQGETAKTENQT